MVKTTAEPTKFTRRVWTACKRVPKGRVTTYAEIAKALRKPRASRAVGNALNASPGMPTTPCHRVVKNNGSVGGFARGTKAKKKLLEKEGVKTRKGKILGFNKKIFKIKSS